MSKRRTRFSIASFLLSLFIIPLISETLAITFGIVALRRIHKNPQILKGESIAIAGIIIATLRLLVLAIIIVLAFTITPQLKPSVLKVKEDVSLARVHIDFLQLEKAIGEYYKKHKEVPKSLFALRDEGFVKNLAQDPFSKDKQTYRYNLKGQARKKFPKADFLIYSVGPDGDDDGAAKQYSNQDKDGDVIRVGHIKSKEQIQ